MIAIETVHTTGINVESWIFIVGGVLSGVTVIFGFLLKYVLIPIIKDTSERTNQNLELIVSNLVNRVSKLEGIEEGRRSYGPNNAGQH